MKDFLKHVLATIIGIFLFGLITIAFAFISIVGMVLSTTDDKTEVKDNSVLVVNLSGQLTERVEEDIFSQLRGEVQQGIGLDDFIKGLKEAKDDDKIKGIYIEAGLFSSNSYASLQEARNAILDFKKSGKWVVAYGDSYTQGAYYLASAADKVWLNPQGMIDWHGLAAQRVYLKDMLGKFGIKMQVSKVGAYKSATETFTEEKMSDSDRAQTTAYLTSIWNNITKEVSNSRKVSVAKLNEYADSMITFAAPTDYIKYKMADKLLYTDQVKKEVKQLLGEEADADINQVSLADMKIDDTNLDDEKIAIYYAYGDIVDNQIAGLFGNNHVIAGKQVCSDLEEIMNDDNIKAVVIRINSGGGSAYASEQMWHQIMELKKVKPVVVSMGGYAASGGYYMSAPANWIVAEPTTITGSIGIFGMFPDYSGLATEKLGLKFDQVVTNKNAAFGSNVRPFNPEEMRMIQAYIDRGYATFKNRVAQGRKMTIQQVENLAQGHVYTGEDALKIKLVDQLGGLDVAVAKAAQLAQINDYCTQSYPKPTSWFEQIMEMESTGNYLDEQLRAGLGNLYEPFSFLRTLNQQSAIQARLPYYININ